MSTGRLEVICGEDSSGKTAMALGRALQALTEQKTVIVDLAEYRNPGVSKTDVRQEYLYHRAAKPCQKEKQRHMAKLEKLVSGAGLELYRRSWEKKEWASSPLPKLERSLQLTTAAEYRRRNGLHSNASAMDHLFRKGAVRIKLGSRALWIVPNESYMYPVALQAPETGENGGFSPAFGEVLPEKT